MARSGYNRAASAKKRTGSHDSKAYTYIDGNTIRRLDVQVQPEPESTEQVRVSPTTRRNRERALRMNLPYVMFLLAAGVAAVFLCVNFLQLRAVNTLLSEEVATLSAEVDSAVLENDSEYNRVMNSVDLEHIKEVATTELGMQQATSDQIVTYEVEDGDYVRQYSEIPTE